LTSRRLPIDATTFRDRLQSLGVRPLRRPAPADEGSGVGGQGSGTDEGSGVGDQGSDRPQSKIQNPKSKIDTTALPGTWQDTPHGPCLVVEHRYPLDHQHGAVPLARLLDLPEETLGQLGRSPAFQGVDRRRLLFFDTETTGLAGGTGTYVFLAGLGFFDEAHFVIRQIFLPDLGSERALLHLFNDLLGRSTCLVSFNGRAFDWPLIEARFTMSRMRPAQGAPLHLDLLAPARRVWKDWLPSCALGTLESAVLQYRRRGDVPGWLIPSLYFEYLRGGGLHALLPVFEHNRLDVLSLLALAGHLGSLIQAPEAAPLVSAECYGLGRLYEDLGDYEASVRCYTRALRGAISAPLRAAALQRLTGAHQKLRQHEEALRIWEELVAGQTTLVFPYVELAKHYEHHTRELAQAATLVGRALDLCKDPWVRATLPRNTLPQLERRHARLQAKLTRSAAAC